MEPSFHFHGKSRQTWRGGDARALEQINNIFHGVVDQPIISILQLEHSLIKKNRKINSNIQVLLQFTSPFFEIPNQLKLNYHFYNSAIQLEVFEGAKSESGINFMISISKAYDFIEHLIFPQIKNFTFYLMIS